MASTMVALQTVTVGAGGVSSITFSSIPQTYTDLCVKISTRTDFAATNDNIKMSFNGSTSSFAIKLLFGSGTAAGSVSIGDNTGGIVSVGANATSSTFGNAELYIPNYTSSNYKSYSADSIAESNTATMFMYLNAGLWSNYSAITSINLAVQGGTNFVQYSTFTLYGVYKDAAETTPAAPTIGTATAGSQAADVAFTPAGSGAPASSYVVTSSPGGLTATGGSSPIQIGGLTSGTAYTFTVRGQNPGGLGAASAASNSVTPYDGYESIASFTLGSATSTVAFSSIPSTFTHLQIRVLASTSVADRYFKMQYNSDTASNYNYHYLTGNGSSAGAGAVASASWVTAGFGPNSTTFFGTSVIDILDYKDTNKFKTNRNLEGADMNGAGGYVGISSGCWRSTSAISSITLSPSSGNFNANSVFELYGIRG